MDNNHFFQQYMSFLQKDILKRKRSCDFYWNHYIDVKHTVFQPGGELVINDIEIEGEGLNLYHSRIHIYIKYHIMCHGKVYIRRKHCKDIISAMNYIFTFPKRFKLCHECLSLYKHQCDACLFYRVYEESSEEIPHCGICKEPTFRTILPCGHRYHQTCLLKMERQEMKCPLCRSPVPTSFMSDLLHSEVEEEEYNSSEDEF